MTHSLSSTSRLRHEVTPVAVGERKLQELLALAEGGLLRWAAFHIHLR